MYALSLKLRIYFSFSYLINILAIERINNNPEMSIRICKGEMGIISNGRH